MISQVLSFSVHQRWLVALLTMAAAAFGAWSMMKLPIDAVPDITNNQVQINTTAPALSPIDIEKQVTYPLETALAGIPGLDHTRSFSRNGFSQITAVFDDKTDVYFARQQINERLNEAKAGLPLGAEPRMGPVSTGLGEIYIWTVHYKRPGEGATVEDGKPGWQSDGSYLTPEGERLTADLERNAYLRTVEDWIIRPQLRTVPGIAGVDSLGGFRKEYHVQPDPAKLIGLDLSFGDVATAIENNNLNRGASYVEDNGEAYAVRAAGRLESMEQIGDVVVATRGGMPVRVKDVAQVKIGRELRTGSASENGEETVIGTALMRIGGNSRSVSAMVDAKMKEINKALPPAVEAKTVLNRTLLVDATVKTVSKNLAEGAFLVILVLFLLLGNFRAALITALVIPIAMLLTMTGMVQGKISANLMSLGALDFELIVDGAVIITENSLRHLAERQHAFGRQLTEFRASQHGHRGCSGDDQAIRVRPSNHYSRLFAAAHLLWHRRQDVRAHGADRHYRSCLCFCSLVDLRARNDCHLHFGKRSRKGEPFRSMDEGALRARTEARNSKPAHFHRRCCCLVHHSGAAVHPARPSLRSDAR